MIKRTNLRVKQHLEPLIEKAFFEMRKRIAEIERETGNREQIAETICNYAGSYLAGESKSLFSLLYKILSEETLGKEPFVTARNQNKFYEKDIWAMIFDKYSFSANTENLYFAIRKKININSYLETLKRELLVWLETIESFYYEQVAEVIKTLADSNV